MRYQTSIATTLTLTIAVLLGSSNIASASQIIETQGSVQIKRAGWSSYRPVTIGTTIEQGDSIEIAAGGTAKVLCDDLTSWEIPAGTVSIVDGSCPSANASPNYHKGGMNASIPYPITPRYTYLINGKPTLKWNAVPNATKYLVTLEGGEINWQTEVKGTEVVYSGDKPLVAGVQYKFTVEADTGVSSQDEGGGNLGFALLSEEDVKLVKEVIGMVSQSNLTPEGKSLALAKIYSTFQLNADAIQTLETLAKQGSQRASVYQMLGDLYAKTGLNLLAEQSYSKAISLASAPQDWSALSQAQLGLVEIKMLLGKADEAQQIVNTAKASYLKSQDLAMAEQLEQLLVAQNQSSSGNPNTAIVTKRGGPTIGGPSMDNLTDNIVTPPTPKISRPEAGQWFPPGGFS